LDELYKQIGLRIRDAREKLGLTQEKLAERADLHPSYIGQIERGTKKASIQTYKRIADALNVPLDWLFQFSEDALLIQEDLLLREVIGLFVDRDMMDKKMIVQLLRIIFERIDKRE